MEANALTMLNIPIVPLHVYGSSEAYDYDNHAFGFTKGDLNAVRAAGATVSCGRCIVSANHGGEYLLEANPNALDEVDIAQLRVVSVAENATMDKLREGVLTVRASPGARTMRRLWKPHRLSWKLRLSFQILTPISASMPIA